MVPKYRVKFLDEIENYRFSRQKSIDLKKAIGLDERRIVEGNECTSDLCLFGLEHLISHKHLNKDEISALIFVTQTPDHFMPPTSTIIHGKLGLDRDVICFDINQGCAGYIYGLLQAFLILEMPQINKVVLLNGDTLSRCSSPQDRNVYPLIGDAGSVTIVERSNDSNQIFMSLKTDGSRSDWLKIPAGGFRIPSTEETRKLKTFPDGNRRSEEHFRMNGPGVFTFTQTDVPQLIRELFLFSAIPMSQVDYFIFHQPNRFLLDKLGSKLGLTKEKLPSNIVEKFGNSSSATIPLALSFNIARLLLRETLEICMAGFGVGLCWGSILMSLGPLDLCELIEK